MSAEREKNESEARGLIPTQRPFKFITEANVLEKGKIAEAKLVDLTKPEFMALKDLFPGGKIVPGVILIEAMAELLGTAATSGDEQFEGKYGVFRRINNLVFRKAILPTDDITLKAEVNFLTPSLGIGRAEARIDGQIAVEGDLTFGIVDRNQLMSKIDNLRH